MSRLNSAIVGRRKRAALRLLTAAGLAVMLAGCYETTKVVEERKYPFDYRDRHPVTLGEGNRSVDVFVGRNRGGLSPSQRADVLSFAQTWRRDATSGFVIDVPRGTPADRAAADSLREINSILAASGVPRRAIFVRSYRPPNPALASIRINYSALVAEVGPCGEWPKDVGPASGKSYFENEPAWNHGCATQRNLASMVDDPADLVQPRGEQGPYTGHRSVAIEKYRKGDVPSGKYDGYEKGKISDLGR